MDLAILLILDATVLIIATIVLSYFFCDILTAMNGGASYEARLVVDGIESNVVCSSR